MTPSAPRLAFALTLALAVAACGGGGPTAERTAKAPAKAEPLKVGLLLDDIHERWEKDRQLIAEVVDDMGAQLLVEVADSDQTRQDAQATKLLEAGVKALLVVAHDSEKAGPLVEQARARNVPVICYDRLIRNAHVALFIGFDTIKIGEMQAESLVSSAPKGNYLLIGGSPSDDNAHKLREGQMQVLAPAVKSGAIRIVGNGWADNWAPGEAARLTKEALDKTRNKLAAIVASNDGLAGGAIGVLQERKLAGSVLVSGQDSELDAAQRIVEGTQTSTIYKSLRTLTRLAARSVVLLAKGEKVDTSRTVNNGLIEVPAMIFDPIVVDKSNIDGVLIGDGFLKREDVYRKAP